MKERIERGKQYIYNILIFICLVFLAKLYQLKFGELKTKTDVGFAERPEPEAFERESLWEQFQQMNADWFAILELEEDVNDE